MASSWRWRPSDIRVVALALLGCALTGVCCFSLIWAFMEWENRPFRRKVQQIHPGMTKEQVLKVLGRDAFILKPSPDGTDPYVGGYMPPKRKIGHEAIAYHGGFDLLLYVFIGPDGKVEETIIVGT